MRSFVALLLNLYVWVLLGRIVIDYVLMINRNWRPSGLMLILVDAVFSLTDPPLKAIRKVVPAVRIGSVALDLSFIILIFGIQLIAPILLRLIP